MYEEHRTPLRNRLLRFICCEELIGIIMKSSGLARIMNSLLRYTIVDCDPGEWEMFLSVLYAINSGRPIELLNVLSYIFEPDYYDTIVSIYFKNNVNIKNLKFVLG